ncbi:hypothetical protein D3Z52_16145 [Clostridiaceae bacterium]|nr:hypothetical protein [Clostridiaceae bacterium]NBI83024.1 hypothetical protein [Clostridiaceae bacterium]
MLTPYKINFQSNLFYQIVFKKSILFSEFFCILGIFFTCQLETGFKSGGAPDGAAFFAGRRKSRGFPRGP